MRQSLALSALVAGPAAARVFNLQQARDNGCKDVHMFVSRGFNEPYPGRPGTLVNSVCEKLDSCDYENVIYNNKAGTVYCEAVHEGSVNGVNQIKAYNEKCPDSKLVLIGYSQGADVAGNILAGGGGPIFECTQKPNEGLGADSPAGKKIAAALTFGDVRHTANQPWNTLGGAGANGVSPRTPEMLAGLSAYGPALRDYCNVGDGICGDGSITEEHLNYFKLYIDDATDFILGRVRAVSGTKSSSSSLHVPVTPVTPIQSRTITIIPNNGTVPTTTAGHGSGNGGGEIDVTVTVPCDNPQITTPPEVVTDVITATKTVTEDCDSKGSVYTATETVVVKCPICLSVPEYSTATDLYETPNAPTGPGAAVTQTGGSHSPSSVPHFGEQPKWTTFPNGGVAPSVVVPGGAHPTGGVPAPTGGLPVPTVPTGFTPGEPTGSTGDNTGDNNNSVPSAPAVSGSSSIVPSFVVVAVAAFMALI